MAADTALQLTENSDEVVLSQTEVGAFQFDVDDSFTIEMTINTSDANGVLLGTRTDLKGWSWQVVDGKLQFTITDLVNSATATSAATINDGAWHRIAVVRNADSSGGPKTISLYIDGVLSGSPVIDPTSIARDATDPLDAVILGAASNQSAASQLAVTIDTLRITRGVLNPAQFLAISFPTPTRPDAPTYASNAPTSIPGLQFWLPSYDPTRFFGDWGEYADPLPQVPYAGMAARSAIEMSPNAYHLTTYSEAVRHSESERPDHRQLLAVADRRRAGRGRRGAPAASSQFQRHLAHQFRFHSKHRRVHAVQLRAGHQRNRQLHAAVRQQYGHAGPARLQPCAIRREPFRC